MLLLNASLYDMTIRTPWETGDLGDRRVGNNGNFCWLRQSQHLCTVPTSLSQSHGHIPTHLYSPSDVTLCLSKPEITIFPANNFFLAPVPTLFWPMVPPCKAHVRPPGLLSLPPLPLPISHQMSMPPILPSLVSAPPHSQAGLLQMPGPGLQGSLLSHLSPLPPAAGGLF